MNRTNIFFGVLLVAIGTLLLLEQIGTLDAWRVIGEWWPAVVVVAGASQLLTRPRNVFGGLLLLTVGGVLLLWTLGAVAGIGLLWPLLLIVVGAWILTGRRTGADRGHAIDVVALFDDRRSAAVGPLGGGEIVTVFGDATCDLRDVVAAGDEVVIQVTTIFGDVDLVVPDTWDVRVSGPEIFGDVRLHGRTASTPDVILRVRVVTVFGDLDIRTVAPSREPVFTHG